jgi:hypothetical protein
VLTEICHTPEGGWAQVGSTVAMKPDQDDCLEAEAISAGQVTSPVKGYSDRRSSAKSLTRSSKLCVVPGGVHSIASAVSLCSYDCRSVTAFTDQSHRPPPTFSARPIMSGW